MKIPQLPSLSPSPDRGSFSGINPRPVISNPPAGKSAIGNISGYISQRPPVVLGGTITPHPQNQLNYYSPNIQGVISDRPSLVGSLIRGRVNHSDSANVSSQSEAVVDSDDEAPRVDNKRVINSSPAQPKVGPPGKPNT